jgi:hypothetical protein
MFIFKEFRLFCIDNARVIEKYGNWEPVDNEVGMLYTTATSGNIF